MDNNQKSIHIILINYNGYEETIECVDSLNKITYNNYKIIVVDNSSTDGSNIKLEENLKKYDKVHYIQSDKNLGFSGGNNLGIQWSLRNKSDYICLLNNDTIVEKDFLIKLVSKMELDEMIGISAGKIMYFDNKDIIWSAGGFINDTKALGCHYGIDQKDNGNFDNMREVTFLTGCLQLIKSSVFEEVGLYDDEYFLYMEDVDFCKRVSSYGYKLMYIPNSKIYHKVSASTGGDESPLQLYYMTRNRFLFNRKNNNDIIISIKFYLFMLIKMIIEPFRKKEKYKYMVKGALDSLNRNYGRKDISKI